MKCSIFRRGKTARREQEEPVAAIAAAVGNIETLCRTIRDALPAVASVAGSTAEAAPAAAGDRRSGAPDVGRLIDEWLNGEEGAHDRPAQ